MATIDRGALREQLWPGIHQFFGMEYKDYEMQYGYIFETRQSKKAYEEYVQQAAFGLAPLKEPGTPVMFDEASEVWKGRVEMHSYGLGFTITREAVEDNQYFDLIPKYSRALKRSMVITKEVRAAAFTDGVFTTSMTGDGKPVVAPDHPLKGGGTLSNIGNSNADLNETSLEAAVIQIADWTDERGLRISVSGKCLIIPNGLQFTAERILTANGRPGTDDNDGNAMRQMGMLPEGYKVNNYLGDPRAWFICTDVPEGMTHWDRRPLDIEEGDGLDRQIMKVISTERYAFSALDPRGLWGQPGQ